jgi:hypothetical protein
MGLLWEQHQKQDTLINIDILATTWRNIYRINKPKKTKPQRGGI